MTLLIDEGAVKQLITMSDALAAVREGFAARGTVDNLPRVRLGHGREAVRLTAAVVEHRGYFGVKISSKAVFGTNAGRVLNLFEIDTGRLCAVVQVFGLGALRTGAVSGVATDHLANPGAEVLTVIGTGRQARTQLDAMLRVRPIERVRIFGRKPDRREEFADLVRSKGVEAVTCEKPRQAVEGADIVVTATSSQEPVLFGESLQGGVHVNAIGANDLSRRELDSGVVRKADVVAVDEPLQAPREAAGLVQPVTEGILDWNEVSGLADLLVGTAPGRSSSRDITLFKSLGTAVGDVVLAAQAYEMAVEQGLGVRIPELSGEVS